MKKLTFLLIFIFSLLTPTFFIYAADPGASAPGVNNPQGTVKIVNPLGSIDSPQKLIGQIINAVLGIIGSLALVMFIYGGFTWMMASGKAEAVTKGKNIIIWATIGLIIIFSSYALVKFVLTNIGALKT